MTKDNQVLVRVNDPTHRAIEQFAEDRDYNKAEAVRRIAESRLKSEGYLTRELYEEKEIRTDGSGAVIRPMLNFLAAIYAGLVLLIFGVLLIGVGGFTIPFIPYGELLPFMISLSVLVAVITVTLYTGIPEKADVLIRHKIVNPVRRKYHQAKA